MKYIFANWKMYLDQQESIDLAKKLASEIWDESKVKVVVFPNTLAFAQVQEELKGTLVAVGAQTVNWSPRGAYTGAVSAELFKSAGATYSLVGHSERRHVFGESNEDVRKKMEACLLVGITPVLCVGETKEDLEADKREYRLKKQLLQALDGLHLNDEQNLIVAYEPVWAISQGGQGVPCSPVDADDIQGWMINEIKQYTDKVVPVLYGGSVNPENVVSYISHDVVAGVLVGSASTKFDSLLALIRSAEVI